MRKLLLWLLVSILALPVFAAPLRLSEPPENPDPAASYLFYLHGAIVEGRESGVEHPRFGAYDYDGISDRLAEEGLTVIGEVRASRVSVDSYAEKIAEQVDSLLEAGVPAGRIAVMGHSKGGSIAWRVARHLGQTEVRFVLLAACFSGDPWKEPSPQGRFLSLLDRTDHVAVPCREVGAPMDRMEERVFEVGAGHGLFYQVEASWVGAVLEWLEP